MNLFLAMQLSRGNPDPEKRKHRDFMRDWRGKNPEYVEKDREQSRERRRKCTNS